MTHEQHHDENDKTLAERKHEQTLEKNENYTGDYQSESHQEAKGIHDAKRYGDDEQVNTDEETSELDTARLTENEDSTVAHGDQGIHDAQRYGETDQVDTDEETSELDAGHLTEEEN
ncbi:hypothetical protein FC84_GL001321 [Lapidilactobacillus dextrinicus DSM 20335]|uniref:Uncharacterized protein n=1 Tax=Lapidilactobacillus dextrinicus DSM 20335 TaxID=1423738 RepID=A0A0R2BUI2_9LACO|nr:hypothetical protein [Lapidilactobacillus dextrinicus]KRM79155.1 hypothetical protein FC84_GL001321 [Lapidilactobacillus dextrinicus DSM 20335]QFG46999.1 hypothetical protein LH506_05835 [Lapidilactobacillus dextrinicus]